jgi:hypothetical protein
MQSAPTQPRRSQPAFIPSEGASSDSRVNAGASSCGALNAHQSAAWDRPADVRETSEAAMLGGVATSPQETSARLEGFVDAISLVFGFDRNELKTCLAGRGAKVVAGELNDTAPATTSPAVTGAQGSRPNRGEG